MALVSLRPIHCLLLCCLCCPTYAAKDGVPPVSANDQNIEHPEEIVKQHFDIGPEFAENMRLLVRMDRHALKTIIENQAALFQTLLVTMVFRAYNASTQAGHCASQKERAYWTPITDQKTQIETNTDRVLDEMYRKWGLLQTQEELEAYFTQFWEDRNTLYDSVSQRYTVRNCKDSNATEPCTAVQSLEALFNTASEELRQCY